jgi:4-hydroxy 2-oxovalerate aldolase
MNKKKVTIYDVSLRDGSHAISHQLTKEQISNYAQASEKANIYAIEVGHGNGLAASSLLVGQSKLNDEVMLKTAKENLINTKLGIHIIPGFATINNDINKAIDIGVDIFRIASHSTEADTTQRHIGYVRDKGKEVYGLLMSSHMTSADILVEEAFKMQTYGAEAIVILDSAGSMLPHDVKERIELLSKNLNIPVGFHGHNNLGLAVSNSIVALDSGAKILDASIKGFGAGAGNTQLEVLVALLTKYNYETNIDLYGVLDLATLANKLLLKEDITISPLSIVSGLSKVFSGFSKHIQRISTKYDVDPRDVFFELGRQKVIAGQEDKIIDVAIKLSKAKDK